MGVRVRINIYISRWQKCTKCWCISWKDDLSSEIYGTAACYMRPEITEKDIAVVTERDIQPRSHQLLEQFQQLQLATDELSGRDVQSGQAAGPRSGASSIG